MNPTPSSNKQTVLFGVTSSQSLKLLGSIPGAMAKIGWDVQAVAGDAESEVPKELDRIKLYILPMKRNPSPMSDIVSLVRWIILLSRIRPAMVVIGTPKAALLGMVASLVCRVPVRVYHLRGLRIQTCTKYSKPLLHFFEWLTAKCSTSVLAVSPSLRQEYCKRGLAAEQKVEVLGFGSSHGVDTQLFRSSRWSNWEPPEPQLMESLRSQIPILGFVGRLSRDKGATELIKCINALRKAEIKSTLLIIGPFEGEEDFLDDLENLNEGVVRTGPLENVAPYYSIMNLLLLPTHREGFPNVVLEAAASGVPTVTTNATGAIDSVVDGETGAIFPIHDDEAFTKIVRSLISSPETLREMGAKARDRVVSLFDASVVTDLHIRYLTNQICLWRRANGEL